MKRAPGAGSTAIASFDRVVVMEKKKVVQDSTPEELRRRHGRFRTLWQIADEGCR